MVTGNREELYPKGITMSQQRQPRRTFLATLGWASGAAVLGSQSSLGLAAEVGAKMHIACNEYPWTVFYQREKQDFNENLDEGLGRVAQSGVKGYEPLGTSPEQVDQLVSLLNRIIVTNPSPIRWGGSESKDDAQLRLQGRSLEQLGKQLRAMGMTLAYHNHDIELRNSAREFHHMLAGTDPEYVSFCLDSHWVYRGSGNSSVALFDVVTLYASRIVELHLRQSVNGIWSEAFGEGDINYPALVEKLRESGVKPHLVLEQAVEEGTPRSLDAVESHRRSLEYAARVFAPLA
jgi:inosose dehydratase